MGLSWLVMEEHHQILLSIYKGWFFTKMRKQFLSLHSGNKAGKKAFIFSLDIIVAVIIVSFVLIVATFYVTKAGGEPASRLQTTRIGSDVLAMLDHNKTLETL